MSKVLEVTGLEGGYGNVQILYGIDLYVDQGEFAIRAADGRHPYRSTRSAAGRRGGVGLFRNAAHEEIRRLVRPGAVRD